MADEGVSVGAVGGVVAGSGGCGCGAYGVLVYGLYLHSTSNVPVFDLFSTCDVPAGYFLGTCWRPAGDILVMHFYMLIYILIYTLRFFFIRLDIIG